MKNLQEYLNESLNIVMQKDGLQLVTLVSRDIECPSLTAEHFSTIMMEDLEEAQQEYSKLVYRELQQHKNDYRAYMRDRIQQQAERVYKQPKRREAYIKELTQKMESSSRMHEKEIIKFHFDMGANYYSYNLNATTNKYSLKQCFEEASRSSWWQYGTGWKLTYLSNPDTLLPCQPWGEILLTMDDNLYAEKEEMKAAAERAIAAYYAEPGYKGD